VCVCVCVCVCRRGVGYVFKRAETKVCWQSVERLFFKLFFFYIKTIYSIYIKYSIYMYKHLEK
jgi:hypothetical protein